MIIIIIIDILIFNAISLTMLNTLCYANTDYVCNYSGFSYDRVRPTQQKVESARHFPSPPLIIDTEGG